MRRVLLIPQVGLSNLLADSSVQFMLSNVEAAHRLGHPHFFYMVVPHWSDGEPPPFPNLHVERVQMNRDFWYNDLVGVDAHFLAEKFGRRGGRYIVDAVHSEMVRSAWGMGQIISDYRAKTPPVFITDPVSIDTWLKQCWEQEVANMAASMACYRMVGSESLKKDYVDQARMYLKPAMVDKYEERVEVVVANGIRFEEMFRIRDEEIPNRHAKTALFCGSRFTPDKGIEFIQKVFAKLFESGRDVYVCSTTNTAQVKGGKFLGKDKSYLKMMKFGCDKEEYMREASRCHVSLSASGEESFALHIIEHLALGLVAVVPDKEWVWEWIPKGYPFVYDSRDFMQAYTIAAWVMDNLERAKQMIEPFCQKVFERYDADGATNKYLSVIDRRINERCRDFTKTKTRFFVKNKFRIPFRIELVEIACGLGESFAFEKLIKALKEKLEGMNTRVLTQPGGSRLGVPTLYDIRAMLHSYGFEDACDGPDVRFVRTAKVRTIQELYGDLIEKAKRLDEEKDPERRQQLITDYEVAVPGEEEDDDVAATNPEERASI